MTVELKNILVTGSTRGLGLGIATEFERSGHTVIKNGRNKSDNISENVVYGDISKFSEAQRVIETCVSELGRLDVVVCNVGSGKSVMPGKEDPSEWKKMFDKNFFSTTNIVEASRKFLKKTGGKIICISSICGIEVIPNAPVTYSVSKAALNFYIKSASRNLAEDNITINAIAPGNLLFHGSTWEEKLKKNRDLVESYLNQEVPLKSFGSIEQIASIANWLASEKADFTTGSVFVIDGGQTRTF